MKYLHLVWAALFRRKIRTVLTLVSIIAAFLLFGLLDSVRSTFASVGNTVAGAHRLLTMSKISFTVQLPQSLGERIKTVPGVEAVTYASWFNGIYQDPKNYFASYAAGPGFFDVYTDFVLPPEQRAAFQGTRTGAVVGRSLAERFGWKLGERIPLEATIWPQRDGSNTWNFDLVGIYHTADPKDKGNEQLFLFQWKYFDEARQFANGQVGWYVSRLADPDRADEIARAIDAFSANSDHETKTQTESAFGVSIIKQFADIGLIVSAIMAAVFFTLVLLVGNTMAQAVRERIPELAVLKTLGFSDRTVLALVLAESVLLVVLGGVIGLALAMLVLGGVSASLGSLAPLAGIGASVWANGLLWMMGIGLIVGALPALQGMRLRIVDALAGR
ncbi:MAG: ABC transporter permease [Gammaproteobacteria bacterium]|nr:ABC transporter permease [Gammaproteobacteria bacterium]